MEVLAAEEAVEQDNEACNAELERRLRLRIVFAVSVALVLSFTRSAENGASTCAVVGAPGGVLGFAGRLNVAADRAPRQLATRIWINLTTCQIGSKFNRH